MTDPRFIHLRLHTEYSVADGLVRVDEAVKRARESAMPALGVSDLANTFGWVKFYRAARGAGIATPFARLIASSTRTRPSTTEYSVCRRRWMKRGSVMARRRTSEPLF